MVKLRDSQSQFLLSVALNSPKKIKDLRKIKERNPQAYEPEASVTS